MQSRRKHSPKDIIWLRGIGWGKIPVAFMQNTHTHIEYIALSDHPKNARLKATNDDDDDDEQPRALDAHHIYSDSRSEEGLSRICMRK